MKFNKLKELCQVPLPRHASGKHRWGLDPGSLTLELVLSPSCYTACLVLHGTELPRQEAGGRPGLWFLLLDTLSLWLVTLIRTNS